MAASAVAPWAQPGARQVWEHCGGRKGERPTSGRRGEMGSQADMCSKVVRPGGVCGGATGMEMGTQLSWKRALRQRSHCKHFPGESEALNSPVLTTWGSADSTRSSGLGWPFRVVPNLDQ